MMKVFINLIIIQKTLQKKILRSMVWGLIKNFKIIDILKRQQSDNTYFNKNSFA